MMITVMIVPRDIVSHTRRSIVVCEDEKKDINVMI